MKKLSLLIDGKEVEVLAQKIGGTLWFHLEGTTYEYRSEASISAGERAAGDPSKILAPMPGKVIKVLKAEGEPVEEGETVITMEAMKMEYNLKSTRKARVRKIHCQENAGVALGDLLAELENSDG